MVPMLLLSLAARQGAPPPAKKVMLTGTVLSAVGKPVANAKVGMTTSFINGKMEVVPGVKTDKKGKFSMERLPWMRSLVAYNAGQTEAAMLVLDKGNTITIKLQKTAKLKFAFEMDGKPMSSLSVMLMRDKMSFGQMYGSSSYAVSMPPGKYDFDFFSMTEEATLAPVTLKSGETRDLGTVKVSLNTLGKMVGNDPPEISVAEARGVEKSVQLKDFKGKWVLLEFWGYW